MSLTLEQLSARLVARAKADPQESYTARLVGKGVGKCAQKLGEEAVETVIAAVTGDREELVTESADLVYHWLVTLIASGVELETVMAELDRRTSQSGLAEKAARTKD